MGQSFHIRCQLYNKLALYLNCKNAQSCHSTLPFNYYYCKNAKKAFIFHLNNYKRDDVMFFRANDGDTDNECDHEDPISSKGQHLLTISQNFLCAIDVPRIWVFVTRKHFSNQTNEQARGTFIWQAPWYHDIWKSWKFLAIKTFNISSDREKISIIACR